MPWICQDCNAEVWSDENMVMLKPELWLSIAKKEDVLCAKCIQKKLKRPFQKSDLIPGVLCNKWYLEKHKMFDDTKYKKLTESIVNKILKEANGS